MRAEDSGTRQTEHALSGIRVLDVTQVMAGPFCAMLLCDMGADVIKVEPPGGDPTRRWAGRRGTDSAAFNAVNRGKRGIVLDLKTPAGRDVLARLAASTDILIENFRPGVMAQWGLDYASLSPVNPGLIYAAVSGYGQTGPSRTKGGFDLIAQGVSGIMSVTGEPDGPPVKAGVPLTDLGAGLFALAGVLAALHHRSRTGRGQQVDTALVDAGVALSVWEATEYFATGQVPQPMGSAHRLSAPYQAVRCADGYLTLGAATDKLFVRLAEVLGHPEWVDDPRFAESAARVRHHRDLAACIETVTRRERRAHWIALLDQHQIPCGPINTYPEALSDVQLVAREMVLETDHPTLGRLQTLGTPVKLSATPLQPGHPAPQLGQHTDEVLTGAGWSPAEVDQLRAQGVVG